MATKTANSYIPDRGEVTIEITVADATALGAGYTNVVDETVIIDGVVRKFEETQPQTRQYSEVFVTAESTPIKTMSSKKSATKWTLTIIDDYSSGGTGEMGSDTHAALEIFEDFFALSRQISQMTVTPAGNASPAIETTLTKVDIESIAHPKVDGDATAPNEVTIMLVVESSAKAAHA